MIVFILRNPPAAPDGVLRTSGGQMERLSAVPLPLFSRALLYMFIQEGYSHSSPLPPKLATFQFRASRGDPPQAIPPLPSELRGTSASGFCHKQSLCTSLVFTNISINGPRVVTSLTRAGGGVTTLRQIVLMRTWKRRECERERAVHGTEMRAQCMAQCVTMATAVCLPKITIHTLLSLKKYAITRCCHGVGRRKDAKSFRFCYQYTSTSRGCLWEKQQRKVA